MSSVLVALVVIGVGVVAFWLIWRQHPDERNARGWARRLEREQDLWDIVGTVELEAAETSRYGRHLVAYATSYMAAQSWQPERDVRRTVDQMSVWKRTTCSTPFDVVDDTGRRARVGIGEHSLVSLPTHWLGTDEESTNDPLPRGKYGALLAGFWEMSLRPGQRVHVFGRLLAQGEPSTLEPAVLVCEAELSRAGLLERLAPPSGRLLKRLVGTVLVVVMCFAAMLAVTAP